MAKQNYYHEVDEGVLMSLADNMAAAATTFNSHGYEVFINSRESFRTALREMIESKIESRPVD